MVENRADYVLSLKGNQASLLEDVQFYFEQEIAKETLSTKEKGHGRMERRTYYLETRIDWLAQRSDWVGLNGIGMVQTIVMKPSTGEMTEERRYYLTSLTDIGAFAHAVRKQWSVENQLHWQLDVTFWEDDSRTRKDHFPLNLNILRKEALRLLNLADFGKRVSFRRKNVPRGHGLFRS